jgi:DNA replicative helicase MCM subunit Mcm2 (Cdc46/Mcm family)
LVLDEIDKGPEQLTQMNDALEGQQVVDIEKAGQSATYDSKCGLLALGNPIDGRFDQTAPISEQLGISETLLSRFDGIITMEDNANTEQDAAVAETYGRSYTEAQQAAHGSREEFDTLDRNVPIDVGRAWVKHARNEVDPILRYEQFEELEEWYAEEVRQLNKEFGGTDGTGANMPVPATVRVLGAAVKMAIAFARCRLNDEVQPPQIERAKRLGRQLIKQNWTGDGFDARRTSGGTTGAQQDRKEAIISHARRIAEQQDGAGAPVRAVIEVVSEKIDAEQSQVRHDINKLKESGALYEPQTGHVPKTRTWLTVLSRSARQQPER